VQEASFGDAAYTNIISAQTAAPVPPAAGGPAGCQYWTLATPPSMFAAGTAAAAAPSVPQSATQFCPAPVYYQVIGMCVALRAGA